MGLNDKVSNLFEEGKEKFDEFRQENNDSSMVNDERDQVDVNNFDAESPMDNLDRDEREGVSGVPEGTFRDVENENRF